MTTVSDLEVTQCAQGPIEVWLRQLNMMVDCTVIHEDESGVELAVDSLSMRGAQREITAHFVGQGYRPDGRWEMTSSGKICIGGDELGGLESVRRFRPPVS